MADKKNTYFFEETETSVVSEALAEYEAAKCQGEYTLEDYIALPEDQRVELIDGVFFEMEAPTSIHQAIVTRVLQSFMNHIDNRHGLCLALAAPVAVQLDCDDKTVVEPDVLVVCDRDKFRRGRVYGAPDLVAEVLSPSTSGKDRRLKLAKYRRAGVREYWLIDPDRKRMWVYEFGKSDSPVIYTFEDTVPVGIFGGECKVNFAEIYRRIVFLYDTL